LSSDLSVTNVIFASAYLIRSVQIPCRRFLEVVDSAYLCRLRIEKNNKLLIYIYLQYICHPERSEGPPYCLFPLPLLFWLSFRAKRGTCCLPFLPLRFYLSFPKE